MFATIGRTFDLMRTSWRVLMKDRELILFPVMAGAVILVLLGVFAGFGAAAGSFDRLSAAGAEGAEAQPVDVVLGVVLYALTYFVVIFFNSALVAAALERLRGGDPNVGSGLRAAAAHLPAIAGWAVVAATVGLLLQAIRDRTDNALGRLAVSLAGGVWAYMTFFVVPVLVAEGIGPIAAVRRSGGLFRSTWGRQVTASFGFGIVYIVALLIAFAPAAALFAVAPIAGLVLGVVLMALAMGAVMALEGIFKAALYQFANGEGSHEFDQRTLQSAYRSL
ncbi:MAG: hypothetical protein FJZ92_13865 [Chloroflexi bacterium]|nr:hypothetical protein [Chloroflexota bacterium]